jgi:uncharacterized protein
MTELIAQVIKEITGAEQILLFGSRATGEFRTDSDYDVLAVLPRNLDWKERLRLASRCRQRLARMGVDVDVLVKSPDGIRDYRDKRGSIVHEALRSGIPLTMPGGGERVRPSQTRSSTYDGFS